MSLLQYSDSNYLKMIQNAVQFGQPCLLENVGEDLDPGLSPILLKQTFRHGGVDCIQLGDSIIEYNDDFRWVSQTRVAVSIQNMYNSTLRLDNLSI